MMTVKTSPTLDLDLPDFDDMVEAARYVADGMIDRGDAEVWRQSGSYELSEDDLRVLRKVLGCAPHRDQRVKFVRLIRRQL